MSFIRKYADNTDSNSVSNKFRRKRFGIFKAFIYGVPKPLKILDVGGTTNFWIQMNFTGSAKADITLLNNEIETEPDKRFKYILSDARDLGMFKDKEFDLVFSNSVIEHVGCFTDQKKMSDEIIRTGKSYFVQTPNFFFPFEPHFLFPFFQFFPKWIKVFLVLNFNLGWFKKAKDRDEASQIINSINLLNRKKIMLLFPEGKIIREKFFFITKSFIITS